MPAEFSRICFLLARVAKLIEVVASDTRDLGVRGFADSRCCPVSDFVAQVLHRGIGVMRKIACVALLIVPFLSAEAATEDWPPLPRQGFISGRVATPADVAAGNAVFSNRVGGDAAGGSTPIRIEITQYAYYKEGGIKIPVIVLQAERVDIQGAKAVQMNSFGAVRLAGKKVVGLLAFFELLGRRPPPLLPIAGSGQAPEDQ